MMSSSLPFIRLKPKANARAIRHGFPWVYDNELVTDRRTKSLAAGSLAVLQDAERVSLGVVAVNPNSRIFCRMLDHNSETLINQAWFATKIKRAAEMRDQLYGEPFYRLVHAEADGLPGVVIDRFGDTAVVQPNAAWADVLLEPLVAALQEVTGVTCVLKSGTSRVRSLEGLSEDSAVLCGVAPESPVNVSMNGATYLADVTDGQKTGLFYDQRLNHSFASKLCRGANVLDVFSHVGGFSLAALAAGAKSALAVDGSARALKLAVDGANTSGFEDRFSTRRGDAFDVLIELASEEAQFDVVICDPPAFAPSKSALEKGLRAYERVARLAAPLVNEGGYLALCSCSHAAELARFRAASIRGIGRAGRKAQLIHTGFAGPDHPLMPQLSESGYLKSLFFRL